MLSILKVIFICYSIGLVSLFLNLFCIILIWETRNIYSRKIFIILLLLQVLHTIENFHFTVLFIPFFYPVLGGGYCVGFLCEPHYVSFSMNVIICDILMANLCGLFYLLLFVRHQSLLRLKKSCMKFGSSAQHLIEFSLMAGINVLPIRYCFAHFASSSDVRAEAIQNLCPSCDWICQRRNFGVIPSIDATVNTFITVIASAVMMFFSTTIAIHIFMIMNQYRHQRSFVKMKVTLSQTRQSLIQVATFVVFLIVPVSLYMTQALFQFDEGEISVVFPKCSDLLSNVDREDSACPKLQQLNI